MLREDVLARARQRAGVEILPASEDRAGLLALTRLMYPSSDIAKAEYAAWQYDANPAGAALARLARAKNTIVGHYTVIPIDFKIGRSAMRGSLSLNTMTHPDYRAKGIFMLLAEDVYANCQKQDAHFTIGFPNQNSYSGFVRHLNFTDLGELPLWILPLSIPVMAQKSSEIPSWALPAFSAVQPFWNLYRKARQSFKGKPALAVEEVTAFDSSFDRLAEQCGADYLCIAARTQRHLRWRFQNHPTRKYRIWVVRLGDDLLGYLVTRITEVQGLGCGMLVDLLARNNRDGDAAARALVVRAAQALEEEGAAMLGCLMPLATPGARALSSEGFQVCPKRFLPQPFPVILRWHGPEAIFREMQDLKNWYLTMGDYDAV